MSLKIKDILKYTNGTLICGNEDVECTDFIEDSREVEKGYTFIGIKGEKRDGSIFWKEAFEKGAETAIINKIDILEEDIEKYKNKNIIQVEDSKKALKQMAIEKRNLYKNLIVIGVTGSVGKTSTKDIIANVMSQKYKTLKTLGNNNNDIGLPLTILRLTDEEVAVIEMGMNHLGEISELTKIARPTVSVITNIGTSHIGNLGSRENILNAKLEILEGMKEPKLIINNDNDLLNLWNTQNSQSSNNKDFGSQSSKVEVHTFGIKNNSECMAEDINKKENSSEFVCNIKNRKIRLDVPVGGDAFILNSMCAALVGSLFGLSDEEIYRGISTFELTKKRMEIVKIKNNITLINDSYNASLDSMKSAIEYLSNSSAKRKIAVFGDMFELGDFAENLHRQVGAEIAKSKIDLLIVIGEKSKYIKDEAEKNGFNKNNILYVDTKEELFDKINNIMLPEDIILFKASHGMELFKVVDKLSKC